MSAVLFPADSSALWLLAIVCYLGVVLYATSVTVRGVFRTGPECGVAVVYAAMFPIASPLALAYALQFSLFASALLMLGPLQLHHSILRRRELNAYRKGTVADAPPPTTVFLIFAPAFALAVLLVANTMLEFRAVYGTWDATLRPAEVDAVIPLARWKLLAAVSMFSSYMAVSSYLDREWVKLVGRIRLLTADSRFLWINVVVAAVTLLAVAFVLIGGTGSAISGYAILIAALFGLLPVANGLAWVYDAVFRRVLAFHLLVVAFAAVAIIWRALSTPLDLSPLGQWTLLLAALGVAAVTLIPSIDRGLERWLFPRANEMRARLMAAAAKPLTERTRADAARGILTKLVAVLDAEGGAIVVHPAVIEPATVERRGSVELSGLGSTPFEVARYVGELAPDGPYLIENLPLADQLRLLTAGVSLICPLVGHHTEATLLLGPRRGWPYDDATIRAMRILARQLGLALENLALANARVHGEKLEALGRAAARIAHEIRNPLAGARSIVQLLGRQDGGELSQSAVEELDRIGRLVNELLAFARRDDVGAREPTDLAVVCAEAMRETGALAAEASVDVQSELGETLVHGDRRQLVQVVANLCRNAIEALCEAPTPRRVSVRCYGNVGRAVIEVSDNGPGVTADERERLFEPFRTTKSSGTGLGLPIARGIVESHGGQLGLESARDSETVFRVELPLLDGQRAAFAPDPPHETQSILRKVG